jgi:hypothetical protein
MALFSKTNVMIKFTHTLALFRVKNAKFLGENIFKIITSVPGHSGANPTIFEFTATTPAL